MHFKTVNWKQLMPKGLVQLNENFVQCEELLSHETALDSCIVRNCVSQQYCSADSTVGNCSSRIEE